MHRSLSDFIRTQREEILAEWDAYARGLKLGLDAKALRNDADRLLTFIADDIDTAQSAHEQQEKSQGRGRASEGAEREAASDHAVHRFHEGFDVNQMVSEYRALRAAVTRLWLTQEEPPVLTVSEQLVRFNEAIDQVVAESIARFSREVDIARQLFLATLGHDLRSPLGAIHATVAAWVKDPGPRQTDKIRADRVLRATDRMRAMIADLLDFTRTQQGSRLPIEPERCDLGKMVEQAVEEWQTTKQARVEVRFTGDLEGRWDCARMGQLVSNLLGNAVTHGSDSEPVRVDVEGQSSSVILRLWNAGPLMSPAEQRNVFKPLARGRDTRDREGLGLGLYICKQIVDAHGGSIAFESSERGIEVTVELPRRPPAEPRGD